MNRLINTPGGQLPITSEVEQTSNMQPSGTPEINAQPSTIQELRNVRPNDVEFYKIQPSDFKRDLNGGMLYDLNSDVEEDADFIEMGDNAFSNRDLGFSNGIYGKSFDTNYPWNGQPYFKRFNQL
ncbi:hypothetical protein CHUAL_003263 [Chamberlinius hualienensis]